MSATLLVELLCEELPPKALRRLGDAFAEGIREGLRKRELLSDASAARAYATPRRLAVTITEVSEASKPRAVEVKLMPSSVAFDKAGAPTPALRKKLESVGLAAIDPSALKRRVDGKAEMVFGDATTPAVAIAQALQAALDEAIASLPVPKMMTYQLADGVTSVQFARPVHGLVALHGAAVVPLRALGIESGRATRGHRFQGAKDVSFASADEYAERLEKDGNVVAEFERRKALIRTQLEAAAGNAGLGAPSSHDALLEEVTALVEMPTVYAGSFDSEFLAVPQECLVLTMRQNQKYFPLSQDGRLTNRFLMVSNMRLDDSSSIVTGNERVVRPRLADARFFFETDRKTRLADRVPQLASRTYHHKLGSDLDRVERLRRLATRIQLTLPRGEKGRPYADRAAFLAKADLVTLMVGEFPELQGIMGRHYAEADGEEPSVVRAIEQHYWPRFAGDQIPTGDVSVAVALADKLEAIAGMFGIGQQPTGDKDPFALRRHALGVVRILVEGGFDLSLRDLVNDAFAVFEGKIGDAHTDAQAFILERLRSYLRDQGYSANEVESVLSMNPVRLAPIPKQLAAVRAFAKLPEAESLASANKRVANILRQAEAKGESFSTAEKIALREPAEIALFDALSSASAEAREFFLRGDYTGYLQRFAVLKAPVDAFFNDVMVMVDDAGLRRNRLALLHDLRREMNQVADIAKLAS